MNPHPVHILAIEFVAAAIYTSGTSDTMEMRMTMVDMNKDEVTVADSEQDKRYEDHLSRYEPQVELNSDPRPNRKPLVKFEIHTRR